MKVKSKYESVLILEKIEIAESSFRKKDESLEGLELGVQVNHKITKLDDEQFEVLLETTVSDEDEKVFVNVKGRAVFSNRQGNMDMFEKNTIAIMFPYIRSYISIITTQPGMNPIVLPAMNIAAMINDKKNNIASTHIKWVLFSMCELKSCVHLLAVSSITHYNNSM